MAELFEQFARLRDEGMTLLIVDQMADYVLAIADRGYVLGGGRVVAEGSLRNCAARCSTTPILVLLREVVN